MISATIQMSKKVIMRNIIQNIRETICKRRGGHLSSSLGCVEILYALYTTANINKDNIKDFQNRDMVVISKEHCRVGQVCTLAHLGLIDKKLLDTYLHDNGTLGHDIYNFVAGPQVSAVDYGTGSLGHGVGVGIGLAMSNPKRLVYVLVGDGELQEGSLWEGFWFIIQHNIKNITIVADRNYMQIDNYTKNIVDTSSNMENIMAAAGFDVLKCDGHDVKEIQKALKAKNKKPKFIIAETIKGKGMEFLLNELGFARFHHSVLDQEYITKILRKMQGEK